MYTYFEFGASKENNECLAAPSVGDETGDETGEYGDGEGGIPSTGSLAHSTAFSYSSNSELC